MTETDEDSRDRRQGLRLRARDEVDLKILSSVLQDAITSPREMTYLPSDKRFVAIFNRFRWEASKENEVRTVRAETVDADAGDARYADVEPDQLPAFQRVHCALCVDRVSAVKRRGFASGEDGRFLELLSLSRREGGLDLTFAGDAEIRLETRDVLCHLEDLGEPWPTRWRPSHPAD